MAVHEASDVKELNRTALVWVIVAQGVSILPLFQYLPFWIPLFWCIAILWRIQILRGKWPFPARSVKFMLGLICIGGLLVSYLGTVGVEPMVAFLVISFVLKLVEVRGRKDITLVIFICFVAIASLFIFQQTLFMSLYAFVACMVVVSAWRTTFSRLKKSIKHEIMSSLIMLAQCIPVMLILFLIMPRLGQLWSVPLAKKSGMTGFSDTMTPGDISELIRSNETAFRVSFLPPSGVRGDNQETDVYFPSPRQRYWRGLVLDTFNGRKWTREAGYDFPWLRTRGTDQIPQGWRLEMNSRSPEFFYEVLLEPHQEDWLFTLMAPTSVSASGIVTKFTSDFLLRTEYPVASRIQYEVRSTTNYSVQAQVLPLKIKERNLKLPSNFNPRSLALVQQWLDQGLTQRELIDRALDLFRRSFVYTLKPPPLGTNSVDEFLFITRRGFCEHYSSAFVFLMRAAGIPARIVLGYQGGDYNFQENYMRVRQSDAHAWTEIWTESAGWERIDPTAVVAPERIEQGLNEAIPETEQELIGGSLARRMNMDWLLTLQNHMDSFSYAWHRWVVGYDPSAQADILRRLLGGVDAWRLSLFLIIGGGLSFVFLFLIFSFWPKVKSKPQETRLFQLFITKMERLGIDHHPGETPLHLLQRLESQGSSAYNTASHIVKLFNAVAYKNRREHMPALKRAVHRFPDAP